MRIQNLNHSTYQHQYHVVWGTKYRRKWLKEYVMQEFITSLYNTVKKCPTLFVQVVNTNEDYVHLQIEIPPNLSVSDVVRDIKKESAKHLRKKFKFIKNIYIDKDGIWSVEYFSSTVGLNENQVRHYIEWQEKKEKPQTTKLF